MVSKQLWCFFPAWEQCRWQKDTKQVDAALTIFSCAKAKGAKEPGPIESWGMQITTEVGSDTQHKVLSSNMHLSLQMCKISLLPKPQQSKDYIKLKLKEQTCDMSYFGFDVQVRKHWHQSATQDTQEEISMQATHVLHNLTSLTNLANVCKYCDILRSHPVWKNTCLAYKYLRISGIVGMLFIKAS